MFSTAERAVGEEKVKPRLLLIYPVKLTADKLWVGYYLLILVCNLK